MGWPKGSGTFLFQLGVSSNRKTGFKLNYRGVVSYKNAYHVYQKSTVKDYPGGRGYTFQSMLRSSQSLVNNNHNHIQHITSVGGPRPKSIVS